MEFMGILADDLQQIAGMNNDGTVLGGLEVIASVVNPLSIAIAYEQPDYSVEEICDEFTELLFEARGTRIFSGDKVDEESVIRWAIDLDHRITGRLDDRFIDSSKVTEDVRAVNSFAFNSLFYGDYPAIQIVANPATDDGKTMSLIITKDTNPEDLVSLIKEQFGDFVMVIYPVDLSIGHTANGSCQYVFHLFNDFTSSSTNGNIVRGDVCSKCGEFFTLFPGQIKFCCKI